jgi:hypothetical protein
MSAFRVFREPDAWVVVNSDFSKNTYKYLGDVDEEIQSRLAVMMAAPVGWSQKGIGRRVSDDAFWVFLES